MGNTQESKNKPMEIPSKLQNKPTSEPDQNESQIVVENDNFTKIKQSLKYLQKNNFTSLTFVFLNNHRKTSMPFIFKLIGSNTK